jgi:hypothetical protein
MDDRGRGVDRVYADSIPPGQTLEATTAPRETGSSLNIREARNEK